VIWKGRVVSRTVPLEKRGNEFSVAFVLIGDLL
jgi:hypothetical protein